MALWQFHSFLLPRAPFEARFGTHKIELPRDRVLEDGDNWPDNEVAQTVLYDCAQILPEMPDYWNEEGNAWGDYESNIIEAGFDGGRLQEISFRIDLSISPINFIRSIIDLARRHDLLLFTEGNIVLSPNLPAFVHVIKSSRAARFLDDPEGYLNRLKQIQ